MILIDTHVLIWFLAGHKKLTQSHQQQVSEAAELKQLCLSAISIWEIAVKERSGNHELITYDQKIIEYGQQNHLTCL